MSRTSIHSLGSLVVGIVAGGLAWLVVDLVLAAAIGISAVASAFLILRIRGEYPDRVTGDTWADKRWTGLGVAVITGVAFFGPIQVPVSGDYRFGLQLLVLLAAFVGYLAGSLAEMERDGNHAVEGGEAVATADD